MNHYKSLGYNNIKMRDIISVTVQELPKGSHQKVDVICDYCGKVLKVVYRDYMYYKSNKYACSHCRQTKTSNNTLRQRQMNVYSKALDFCLKNNYSLLTPMEEIKTVDSIVQYNCQKHGLHETKIYSLALGKGCFECSVERNSAIARKDPDAVYNDFNKYGGELINKDEYIGWNYKNLKVVCKECGNIFITSYGAFMKHKGQVCPKCSKAISKGERAVLHCLKDNKIEYARGYSFNDCRYINPLPFDFYLPEFNLCIEYDGEGHYMPIPRGSMSKEEAEQALYKIQERDQIKTSYCEMNNIKLLRIPYWDYENIDKIIKKQLFT